MPSTFTAELVLVRSSAHDESHPSRSHHLPCRRSLGRRAGGKSCSPTVGGTSNAAILSLFLTLDRHWRPLLRYLFRRSPPFTVLHAIFSRSCRRACSTRCCPSCECVLECRVFSLARSARQLRLLHPLRCRRRGFGRLPHPTLSIGRGRICLLWLLSRVCGVVGLSFVEAQYH